MYSTFSEPLATINNFIALKAPSEASLNERYTAVERIKFDLDSKYRLHPNNFVKMRVRDDYVLEL
jgi:hypothetical protein